MTRDPSKRGASIGALLTTFGIMSLCAVFGWAAWTVGRWALELAARWRGAFLTALIAAALYAAVQAARAAREGRK